jgi:hypothetical protein
MCLWAIVYFCVSVCFQRHVCPEIGSREDESTCVFQYSVTIRKARVTSRVFSSTARDRNKLSFMLASASAALSADDMQGQTKLLEVRMPSAVCFLAPRSCPLGCGMDRKKRCH